MPDKVLSPSEMVAQIHDGDCVAVGGWGPTRKPLALIREICRSSLKDLTVMSFGGFDIDLLIAAGKIKKAIYGCVTLEGAPGSLDNFRRARQEAAFAVMELSEGMLVAGLMAAAERLPFYPTHSGIGTDILNTNPEFQIIESPYTKEKLVAMPALEPDVALIHVNCCDPSGYGLIAGDPFFDNLFSKAAKKIFMSAERIVPLKELKENLRSINVLTTWVTGVTELPYGAHPGACYPEYGWDESHMREYAASAASAEAFKAYLAKYVIGAKDNATYVNLIGGSKRLAHLRA